MHCRWVAVAATNFDSWHAILTECTPHLAEAAAVVPLTVSELDQLALSIGHAHCIANVEQLVERVARAAQQLDCEWIFPRVSSASPKDLVPQSGQVPTQQELEVLKIAANDAAAIVGCLCRSERVRAFS